MISDFRFLYKIRGVRKKEIPLKSTPASQSRLLGKEARYKASTVTRTKDCSSYDFALDDLQPAAVLHPVTPSQGQTERDSKYSKL